MSTIDPDALECLAAIVEEDGFERAALRLSVTQSAVSQRLREGQVLGCVTTLKQALRGCKVVPLGVMQYVAVAQARYARDHFPQGLGPHNFLESPFIAFNRKDDMQSEFVGKAFGLKHVSLNQLFVPSSEGQVRALLAGWGASVVPELLARGLLQQGELVNIAPSHTLPIQLYWHCWNLESEVLDALTAAITGAAGAALRENTPYDPPNHNHPP